MRKSFFPLVLLVLIGAFFLLLGQGDGDPLLVASTGQSEAETSGFEQASSGNRVMAFSSNQINFAVFAILGVSVLLAMRKRPHLMLGRRRR